MFEQALTQEMEIRHNLVCMVSINYSNEKNKVNQSTLENAQKFLMGASLEQDFLKEALDYLNEGGDSLTVKQTIQDLKLVPLVKANSEFLH